MAFVLISGEDIINADGSITKRCVLLSDDTPSSLDVSGADVPGLNDDDVIAAGSVIIAPSANYIAFEDGTFTQKS